MTNDGRCATESPGSLISHEHVSYRMEVKTKGCKTGDEETRCRNQLMQQTAAKFVLRRASRGRWSLPPASTVSPPSYREPLPASVWNRVWHAHKQQQHLKENIQKKTSQLARQTKPSAQEQVGLKLACRRAEKTAWGRVSALFSCLLFSRCHSR